MKSLKFTFNDKEYLSLSEYWSTDDHGTYCETFAYLSETVIKLDELTGDVY